MADNKKPQIRIQKVNANQIKNDGLKDALAALKETKTKENENKMFAEAKKARFLVPVMLSNVNNQLQTRFVLVNTQDGKSYFPAFTDEEEAKKLDIKDQKERQYIVRNLKEFELLFKDPNNKATGIVINPMSANIVFPKELIKQLNETKDITAKEQASMANGAIPAGTQVRFEEPRIYPTKLVSEVYEACRNMPEVSRVWFKQMMAGFTVNFALIVEADPFSEELAQKIRETAIPYAKDVPVVVLKYTEQLEKAAVKGAVALYDKELEF